MHWSALTCKLILSASCLRVHCYREGLTASPLWHPSLHSNVVQRAGSAIGLQELAVRTIHCRVFAQGLCTGSNKGLCVHNHVTSWEGLLLQDMTPVTVLQCEQLTTTKNVYVLWWVLLPLSCGIAIDWNLCLFIMGCLTTVEHSTQSKCLILLQLLLLDR